MSLAGAQDQGADAAVEAVTAWAAGRGLELYPHQESALLEVASGANVICSTPTGSGKSLIAMSAHTVALAEGRRTYYTAPLKALVSEKFFDLVDLFGADLVGMVTGDVAINADAPIICCTAEILANLALREGELADVGQVVADEFHYYADPQRGWAWQVPLLELTQAQFVLLSATLGDVSAIAEDLTTRTGRPTAVIDDAARPVPLTYAYSLEPLAELLQELVTTHRAPVYVVHTSQAAAVTTAQALTSTQVATRAQRDAIAAFLDEYRVTFSRGFGSTLSRLLRHGIGVHHAGMLPRYRRVVERLTQAGLLPVICGTDTLGVGINVPIRTVVLTSLVKFDGVRQRHLSAREFHQVAGRAGRAGYDTLGEVIVQAPEHVIENAKALAKAGDDERKRRKIVRKQAPAGQVNWTDKTFERLRDAAPEPLTSQMRVTHAMVLSMLSRWGDPVTAMAKLLTDNHEAPSPRNTLVRDALRIYRSLRAAGIVEKLAEPDAQGRQVRLATEVPIDVALDAPLSPFALAALELLDPEDPSFVLDAVSVVEATLEDPRPLLIAQDKAARGEAIAAMKADGVDYIDRMNALDDITYPRPLEELLSAALAEYAQAHPWVDDHELKPKSVVREMLERAMTFGELISSYGIARSEGVLLRYLTDAYRALRRMVPPHLRTEELEDVVEWLGATVRGVDSSLLDEWESLASGGALARLERPEDDDGDMALAPPVRPITDNVRAFRVMVRNAMFRRVELLAREAYDELGDLDGAAGWDAAAWRAAADPYWDEYDDLGIGPEARAPSMLGIEERGDAWVLTQILDDPAGDKDWRLTAVVDIAASVAEGEPVLRIERLGPL
ncbi:DEAD/DEAH box helicase [Pseudactinotalea terrae]|uniref:DEAD/DEAH box helicase n=1 Tax=Pseudactinotalea terrae TaxID=1743262 RepID=UPI0012E1A975|nr:DEAD/DEAH box helicase [Pseudactinotalea terrae]